MKSQATQAAPLQFNKIRKFWHKTIQRNFSKDRMKYRVRRTFNRIYGNWLSFVGGKTIRTYWWHYGIVNLGDFIGPELLKANGFYPFFRPQDSPDLAFVSVGTVLDTIPDDYRGIIFGTGLSGFNSTKTFPHAKISAVRGKLTKERLKCDDHVTLGDPGLILCDIMPHRKSKKFALGIIAHYIDKNDPKFMFLQERLKNKVFFIDVKRNPIDVALDIDQCETILSSSLHGCVVADSLHIPNARIGFNKQLFETHEFKFNDYYSVFDNSKQRKAEYLQGDETINDLLKLPEQVPETVSEIQAKLREAFKLVLSRLEE